MTSLAVARGGPGETGRSRELSGMARDGFRSCGPGRSGMASLAGWGGNPGYPLANFSLYLTASAKNTSMMRRHGSSDIEVAGAPLD